MNTSMTVALVLTAYNSMAGVLRSATDQVSQFKSAVTQARREVSGGFMSEEWFRGALEGVRQAQQALNQMRTAGTADLAEGMGMIAPVEQVVRKAAELEDVMQEVRANIYEAGMPAEELDRLMGEVQQKALELGAATRYSAGQSGSAMLTLIKGGMDLKTVLEGGAEASLMLAQVAKIPPDFSAEAMIKIGNAFNVTGKGMLAVADTLSRIDAASTASVPSLLEGMKYVSGTAAQMGLSVKETAAALAVLTNRGMEGSIAGTSLNQMLLRLTPDAKEAAKALEKVGINFQRDFFDAAGRAKPLLEIIEVLREHLAGLPENVKMDILTDVFRVEGARAAIALMQEGKGSLEEINAAYARAIPLQERVAMMQETFAAKWENMKGSLENLMSAAGTPFMNEIKGLVDQAMDLLNVLTDWISANPQVASGIAKVLVALGGLKIATGIGRLAISFLGEPLLGAANVALRAVRSLKGFYETFRYFREGAGFFRALWGAISFGHPTITRLGLLVGRLGGGFTAAGRQAAQFGLALARAVAQGPGGFISFAGSGIRLAGQFGLSLLRLSGQAMLAAGRMAAAWLIGLGPVGWIILGVGAAIAGAVIAWQKNLFGFRDKASAVWRSVREGALGAWNFIKGLPQALARLPEKLKEIKDLGFAELLKTGLTKAWSFILKEPIKSVDEIFPAIGAKLGQLKEVVLGKLEDAWTAVRDFLASLPGRIWSGLKNLGSSLAEGFKKALSQGGEGLKGAFGSVVRWLTGGRGEAKEIEKAGKEIGAPAVKGVVEGIKSGLTGANLVEIGKLIVLALLTIPVLIGAGLGGLGYDLAKAIFRGMKEKVPGLAREAASWIRQHLSEPINRLVDQALEWGKNLLGNFIRGIKEKALAIPEALRGVAQKIKDFLGFSSPTREGPGRTADRWAPAFVGMYVQGLLRGRRQITAAAASLAAALALATAQLPSVGPLPPAGYLVRPAVEAPVLPPATEGAYFVRPVLGPSEAAAAATLRLAAAGAPAAAGGERTEFHLHIQKIEVLGSGRPDYDARRLAERLGPEIERWLEARAKYRQSRTARGFRGS